MRHTIETAPNVVILEASHARRGFAISWLAQTLVTAALIGICLHAEVVAYVARYASQLEISKLITIVPPVMAQQTPLPKDDEAAQLKQAVDSATAELRQSLQQEHDRAEALATELAKARRDLETQVALSSKKGDEAAQFKQAAESAAAELRQSLQRELGWVRDLDQAAQLKQAAESATAELRQSLQEEHDRAEALAGELAAARRAIETQAALSSKTGAEAAQLNQAAESAKAELRQSLKKEHDRAEALASELARARRDTETQVALASKAGDEAAQLKQATGRA